MSWGLPDSDVESENVAYIEPEYAITFKQILIILKQKLLRSKNYGR